MVIVVVVGVALGLVLVVLARRGSSGDVARSSVPTTAESTTADPTASTAGSPTTADPTASTAGSPTTADPTASTAGSPTTATAVAPATGGDAVEVLAPSDPVAVPGAILPGAPGVLWALTRANIDQLLLARVDLRTGATVRWPLGRLTDASAVNRMIPLAGGLILGRGRSLQWYPAGGGAPAEISATTGFENVIPAGATRFWLVPFDEQIPGARVVQITPSGGQESIAYPAPGGLYLQGADEAGRLIGTSRYGGVYRVEPERAGAPAKRLSGGQLLKVTRTAAIVEVCDAGLACHVVRLDLRTGALTPAADPGPDLDRASLSGDGAHLAGIVGGALVVDDLVDGRRAPLGDVGPSLWFSWTADGRALLVGDGTRVHRFDADRPSPQDAPILDLDVLGPVVRGVVGPAG